MKAPNVTPGEWNIIPSGNSLIIAGNQGYYDIAVVRNVGPHDNEANARMMAASKQLAETLHDTTGLLLSWLEHGYQADEAKQAIEQHRAALLAAGYTEE